MSANCHRWRRRSAQSRFVVRKLEIQSASVNVEMFAEFPRTHGGTLDVPARTPRPKAKASRLAGLGGFPQYEVQWITLGAVDLDARTGAQVVEFLAGQLSYGRTCARRT